jgi:hypothetical protein
MCVFDLSTTNIDKLKVINHTQYHQNEPNHKTKSITWILAFEDLFKSKIASRQPSSRNSSTIE